MAHKYKVVISRVEYQRAEIEVRADSRAEAINLALGEADDYVTENAEESVESAERVKPAKPKAKKSKKGRK